MMVKTVRTNKAGRILNPTNVEKSVYAFFAAEADNIDEACRKCAFTKLHYGHLCAECSQRLGACGYYHLGEIKL